MKALVIIVIGAGLGTALAYNDHPFLGIIVTAITLVFATEATPTI